MGDISGLYKVLKPPSLMQSNNADKKLFSVTPFKANFMHSADVTLGELKL